MKTVDQMIAELPANGCAVGVAGVAVNVGLLVRFSDGVAWAAVFPEDQHHVTAPFFDGGTVCNNLKTLNSIGFAALAE